MITVSVDEFDPRAVVSSANSPPVELGDISAVGHGSTSVALYRTPTQRYRSALIRFAWGCFVMRTVLCRV